MSEYHTSVLLDESVSALISSTSGIYADATFGGGGHTKEILRRLDPDGRVISFDRDSDAIANKPDDDRLTLIRSDFRWIHNHIIHQGYKDGIDGVLADLGVSSHQFDTAERGFSYRTDAPLDMRMNNGDPMTAHTIVNTWSYEELKRILYEYGEERYAPQIAGAICRRRAVSPIETTLELVDIIRSAMPPAALREKQHPAKRSFQAIRIAVNDELGSVEKAMEVAIPLLNPGGRLAVITFHSLEDRIVKLAMNDASKGCTCPPNFPVCVCGKTPAVKVVTKKPIVPSERELDENPRSRSAKLRVLEKI